MNVLVCIQCGSEWEGNGSPAACPNCSKKEGKKVLSCCIVKEVKE